MRILQIDVNAKDSSTGDIVYALHKALEEQGEQSLLCYGRGLAIKEQGIYKFALDWETRLHALLTRITGYTGIFSIISTNRLIKAINEFKPQLVHISELHSYFVNPKKLVNYLKTNNIPTIWSFHCDIMYTGKCGVAVNCNKWQTGCGNCPRLKAYPKTLFFDHTAYMWQSKKKMFQSWQKLTITIPSLWLKNRVKQSFLSQFPTKIIANGVDTDVFKVMDINKENILKSLNIGENKKILLTVMPDFDDKNKGGKFAIELAEEYEKNNADIVIIAVCRESKEYKNLPNNLKIIKNIKGYKLAELYNIADVFLLLSQMETFSLTTAEALCCGCAVIGFKCGAPETIYEQPFASFINYGDINKLKNAIAEELKNPQNKKTIEQYAKGKFSKQTMINKYIQLYKQILHIQ